MKKKVLHAILLSIFLLSLVHCKSEKQEKASRNIHSRLISFKDNTVMDVDDIISLDTDFRKKIYLEDLNNLTDTVDYRKGEIYVSVLSIVNGCTKYGGNIDFNKDTLFLKLDELSDTACTEPRCDRLIYRISNPKNKKYLIKKY